MEENDKKTPEFTNLVIKPGVVRTPEIDAFLEVIDPLAAEKNLTIKITSGKRSAEGQLNTIIYYAKKMGLMDAADTLTMDGTVEWQGKIVPCWQPIWEQLLEPPEPLKPILIAPVSEVVILTGIRKGQTRKPSDHIQGKAIDTNSALPDTKENAGARIADRQKIYDFFIDLQKNDPTLKIRQVLLEKEQDCVHCGLS